MTGPANSHHRPRRGGRRRAAAGAAAAASLTVLAVVLAAAAPGHRPRPRNGAARPVAAARSAPGGALVAGHGLRLADGEFVGLYRTPAGRPVYCISPDAALPPGVALRPARRLPGVDAATTRVMAYALARWGAARTDRAAAVESQVLNTLAGNDAAVSRRMRALPPALARVVATHLRLARRSAGPYTVRLQVRAAALPGRTTTATVRVTGRDGVPVAGTRITLQARHAAVPAAVTTGRDGAARFPVRVQDVGEVTVTATAGRLPALTLLTGDPAPGQQRMVGWATPSSARAALRFRARPAGLSHRYACSTVCDGQPTLTLRSCAPPGTTAGRLVVHVGDRPHVLAFPASGQRRCATLHVVAADGDVVSAAWRYLTPHGWSAPQPTDGTFTVDCPPVPVVGVDLVTDCDHARLTIALADPDPAPGPADGTGAAAVDPSSGGPAWQPSTAPAGHAEVLLVGGAQQARLLARPGRPTVFTMAADCAHPQTVTARAGVQRASGDWTWGPLTTITTPAAVRP